MIATGVTPPAGQALCERCHRRPSMESAHDCPECSMRLLDRLLPLMGEPATVPPFPGRAKPN